MVLKMRRIRSFSLFHVVGVIGLGLVLFAIASSDAFAQSRDGRWFGRGERDACGNDWAAEFAISGSDLKGRFWRAGVLYDVYGSIDADGWIDQLRSGKNRREFGILGPRFLDFLVRFDAETGRAEGIYAIEAGHGALSCETPIVLQKSLE